MKGRKWYSLKKELRPFITGKSMYQWLFMKTSVMRLVGIVI